MLHAQRKLHVPLEVVVPKIRELGLAERPKEACGIVIPDLKKSVEDWVLQLVNRAAHPTTSYEIDPEVVRGLSEDLLRAEQVWEDVVIWHTHPSGHVGPSEGDMRSRIEGLKYLVVSLPHGEAVYF